MSSVTSKPGRKRAGTKVKVPFAQATFARNLEYVLAARGLSQNKLAQRSGVSQKHINNAVRCRTTSSIDIVYAIARELAVTPELLLWPGLPNASWSRIERLSAELRDTRGWNRRPLNGEEPQPWAP